MTFAIIQTGGKQYKVAEGSVISVEIMKDKNVGDTVVFDTLLVDTGSETKVGTPTVSGSKVEAEIVDSGKGRKVEVYRFRAKSRYTRRYGHRQPFMKLKITSVR